MVSFAIKILLGMLEDSTDQILKNPAQFKILLLFIFLFPIVLPEIAKANSISYFPNYKVNKSATMLVDKVRSILTSYLAFWTKIFIQLYELYLGN